MTRMYKLMSLVAAMAVLAGCSADRQGAKSAPAAQGGSGEAAKASNSQVVATVNGEKVTMEDLDKLIKPQLMELEKQRRTAEHNMRQQGLESLVTKKLVDAEVKRRGITQEQLFKTEVADKVPPPTSIEVKDFYEKNKAMIQQRQPGITFAQIQPQITQFLGAQKMQAAEQAYVEGLRKAAKVDINLPEPELPRVQVAAEGPARGPDTAPVTLVVFSDFQCPYCSQAKPVLDEVKSVYGDKVRIVFRDFPLSIHPDAEKAAEAGHCADEQGKFWEMHDAMFAHQDQLKPDGLKALAKSLNLDAGKFDQCLDSGRTAEKVKSNMQAGQEVGVNGTPTFFVNGQELSGAIKFDELKKVIERELATSGQKGRA